MNNSGTSAPSGAMFGPWGSSTPRRDLPGMHKRDLRIEWPRGPGFSISNLDKREDFSVPKQLWVSDRSDSETRRNATDVPKIKNRLGIPRTENEVVKVFFGDFRFPTWRVQGILETFTFWYRTQRPQNVRWTHQKWGLSEKSDPAQIQPQFMQV